MVVISVHDAQEYASAMGSKDQLIVIDFTASWCGPCKVMAPIFDKLSGQFPTAKFLKIDVDEHQEIAQKHGIQAMPTFHLYKNGQRLEELRGANAAQLELLIKKHAASATGGSSAGPAYIPTGFTDLSEFVHKNQIECLNEKTGTARNVFSKGGAELESDCDEQLILVVPFTQAVKLHSIKFISKRGDPLKKAPKTVKLYLNRTHLSFDEAEKEEPTQVLQLTAKDYEDDQSATALRFVKFQNVNSIAIFLQDNLGGGDVTALEQLVFIGQPLQQTRDISELKKDPNAAE